MKLLSNYGREYFWIPVLVMIFFFGGHDGRMVTPILIVSFLFIIPAKIIIKDFTSMDRPTTYLDNLILDLL